MEEEGKGKRTTEREVVGERGGLGEKRNTRVERKKGKYGGAWGGGREGEGSTDCPVPV